MKYVLDSSAALPWVLPEKDSAKAIQLRDDARNAVHELCCTTARRQAL
jgi:predicted nucleic acid-binding protein